MSGPALNPIANTAPVAPAKSLAGTRPDASAEAAPADAGEQGFATELKRQMRSGEAGSDDDSARPADAANEADQARADGQTAADGAAVLVDSANWTVNASQSKRVGRSAIGDPPARTDAPRRDDALLHGNPVVLLPRAIQRNGQSALAVVGVCVVFAAARRHQQTRRCEIGRAHV